MNKPLRRVGILMMVLFALLFANLNWVQAYKSDEYRTDEHNCRARIADHDRPRGNITAGRDGEVVAASTEVDGLVAPICTEFTPDGAQPGYVEVAYLREYPFDDRYAHAVGYLSFDLQPQGIERHESDLLAGTSDKLFVDRLRDMFSDDPVPGGNVLTTLVPAAQEAAFDGLQGNAAGTSRGAAVALDPSTGAVQAMVSIPSFDPNPLASPDREEALAQFEDLDEDPERPRVNRTVADRFPPGSIFKVIDSAAALQQGASPDTVLDGGAEYFPPTAGAPIRNAPGVNCPSEITLQQSLAVSCNTAFSHLMAEELGGDVLTETAASFGIGEEGMQVGRLDGTGLDVATSQVGDMKRDDGQDDPPTVAQSAIGQANVALTPLQAATIAATVANDGVRMQPYLVEQLQAPDLRSVYNASPEQLGRAVPAGVAADLQDMMVSVVTDGTGGNAAIPGVVVGGKTGTAETGDDDTHGWFIGFAIVDGTPVSAVAVMLENAGTGGTGEATRIAGEVMRAVIEDQGGG